MEEEQINDTAIQEKRLRYINKRYKGKKETA
jgi:hypothetical protein